MMAINSSFVIVTESESTYEERKVSVESTSEVIVGFIRKTRRKPSTEPVMRHSACVHMNVTAPR